MLTVVLENAAKYSTFSFLKKKPTVTIFAELTVANSGLIVLEITSYIQISFKKKTVKALRKPQIPLSKRKF